MTTPQKNTIVLFGDSGNWYNDSGDASFGSATAAPSGNAGTYSRGLFENLQILAGQPFRVIHNGGVVGETTTQYLSRFQAEVIDKNPGWVFFFTPGSNDIANSVASATTIQNLKYMFQAMQSRGIKIITCTIPPRLDYTQTTLQAGAQINEFLKDWATTCGGFYLADVYPVTMDTTSLSNNTGGHPVSGGTLDGYHYNSLYAYKAAQFIYRQLKYILPPPSILCGASNDGTNGDLAYISKNPLMLAGTGGVLGTGVTGALPQEYYAQRDAGTIAAVASVVSRSTGGAIYSVFNDNAPGSLLKLAVSGSNGSDQLSLTMGTRASTPVASDGPYIIEAEVGAGMSVGTLKGFYLHGLFSSTGPTNYEIFANAVADVADDLNTTSFSGILRTRPFYTPASVSSFFCNLSVITSSAAVGDIYIGRYAMRKLVT